MSKDKRMLLKDAVSKYLNDGDSFTIGGIGCREPMAVTYEIIRQQKRELTLITDSKMDSGCWLIGAGCIKKIEAAYCWIGAVGSGINYRRALEKGIPRKIEVEEYTNYAASLRFLAGAMGISFMPTSSMLGSDIPTYNSKLKIVPDPYNEGKNVVLVPAANPDVAFIHVQYADISGNSQIWGVTTNDMNIARAAKKVVITCEKIVPTSEIRKQPNMTAIPHYCVDAVVEVPFGSHPFFVAGHYWCDLPFRRTAIQANATQEGFEAWLNEWVYGVKDFGEYLEKVGKDRLDKLVEMEIDNYTIK